MNKLQEAYRHINSGNFKQTVKICNTLLTKDRTNLDPNIVRSLKALAHARLGQEHMAMETLNSLTDDCAIVTATIMSAAQSIQRVVEIIPLLERASKAAQTDKDKSAVLTALAGAYITANDADSAQKTLKRLFLVEKDPATVLKCVTLQAIAATEPAAASKAARMALTLVQRDKDVTQEKLLFGLAMCDVLDDKAAAASLLDAHGDLVDRELLDDLKAHISTDNGAAVYSAALADPDAPQEEWKAVCELLQHTDTDPAAIDAAIETRTTSTALILRTVIAVRTGSPQMAELYSLLLREHAPARASLLVDIDPILVEATRSPDPRVVFAVLMEHSPTAVFKAKVAVVGHAHGFVGQDAVVGLLEQLREEVTPPTQETELGAIVLAAVYRIAGDHTAASDTLTAQNAAADSGAVKASLLAHNARLHAVDLDLVESLSLHHIQHESVSPRYVLMPSLDAGDYAGVAWAVDEAASFFQEYLAEWGRELMAALSETNVYSALQFAWMRERIVGSGHLALALPLALPRMFLAPGDDADRRFAMHTMLGLVRTMRAGTTARALDNTDGCIDEDQWQLCRPGPWDGREKRPALSGRDDAAPAVLAAARDPPPAVTADLYGAGQGMLRVAEFVCRVVLGETPDDLKIEDLSGSDLMQIPDWLVESLNQCAKRTKEPLPAVPESLTFFDTIFCLPVLAVALWAIQPAAETVGKKGTVVDPGLKLKAPVVGALKRVCPTVDSVHKEMLESIGKLLAVV
ncbi:hypothetical protein J8273_5423 [Carpediemonas membranifera]|uniref:Uncharacterized protein n=1 Tax=Carpediemonas membranifera TaxID=201153 RepID=A0A8J6AZU3_9EUKA|nr:hypothetical protein J8273_5423 [Carpediemonas membranifera]|eukprot:KAG9392433.1 hypothetical protein J8273_5423 [Carpediemonas membranifera]